MQKIIPNIWSNGKAKEAADFYTSVFPNSEIVATSYYPQTAEEGLADFQQDLAGKELTVDFEVAGFRFTLINADDTFAPNPSISFFVNFDPSRGETREQLDELWAKLSDGGQVLMALDKYDWSEYYGWVQDKYGVSWQLMLSNSDGDPRPFIVPSLQFGGAVQSRATEAIDYYTSVFENSKKASAWPYGEPTGPATAESLMYADFQLDDQWFAANDSGVEQDFTFSPGISLMINCKDQAEIDYLWEKLSSVPEAEQCGWCQDKFGVSWQVTPENMEELMKKPGAYKTMMQQHKIVIAEY